MTMYRSVDGLMNDFHIMLLGSRAAGGFGLVFPEQLAITPDGRTSTGCGGIYDDAQIEGLGFNTPDMRENPLNPMAFMVERGARVRREIGIPVGVSWNLGLPAVADQMIRSEMIDLIFLGRPALSNPHWPVWAARELEHPDPFSLVPEDWAWWLRNFRAHEACIDWPLPGTSSAIAAE